MAAEDAVNTITIGTPGVEYEIEGAMLIAERYEDGTELRISCASGSQSLAMFAKRGPRGGLYSSRPGGTAEELEEWANRLLHAARHVRIIEAYRRERWG
jgi:hypothetical protein